MLFRSLLPEDADKKSQALEFLKNYFAFLEKDSHRRREIAFAQRILPTLQDVETVIDYRVVVESFFDWNMDDPAKYKPVCKSVVPVVIIEIERHDEETVVLQCEESDVEMIIRKLQATLRELKASKNIIG